MNSSTTLVALQLPRITALYSGIFTLFQVWLFTRVVRQRFHYGVAWGDGSREDARTMVKKVADEGTDTIEAPEVRNAIRMPYMPLTIAIRQHGNFTEQFLTLITLNALAEITGAPNWLNHASCGAFAVGRVIYLWVPPKMRWMSHALNLTGLISVAGWNMYSFFA